MERSDVEFPKTSNAKLAARECRNTKWTIVKITDGWMAYAPIRKSRSAYERAEDTFHLTYDGALAQVLWQIRKGQ